MTDADARLARQRIDCDTVARKYERANEAYRHGVKAAVAEARDKISRLKFERDELRLTCKKERVYLAQCEAEVARGFEK